MYVQQCIYTHYHTIALRKSWMNENVECGRLSSYFQWKGPTLEHMIKKFFFCAFFSFLIIPKKSVPKKSKKKKLHLHNSYPISSILTFYFLVLISSFCIRWWYCWILICFYGSSDSTQQYNWEWEELCEEANEIVFFLLILVFRLLNIIFLFLNEFYGGLKTMEKKLNYNTWAKECFSND